MRFTPADGLAQSSIYNVTEDTKGLLWISTGGGVDRYDGSGFSHIPIVGAASIKPTAAQGLILLDETGRTWIGGVPGLYFYNAEKAGFESWGKYGETSRNVTIVGKTKQTVWYINNVNRLIGIDVNTLKERTINIGRYLDTHEMISSCSIVDNRIYYLTQHTLGCVSALDGALIAKRRLVLKKFPDLFDYDANYLVVLGGGLKEPVLMHKTTLEFQKNVPIFFLSGNRTIHRLYRKGDDLFVATVGVGLSHFSWSQKRLISFYPFGKDQISSPATFNVNTLTLDNGNQLWIGTDGGGLYKLNLDAVVFGKAGEIGDGKKIQSSFIRTFCEMPDGKVWVGTYRGGLYACDTAFRTLYNWQERHAILGSVSVTHIYKDRKGSVWLGTNTGIFQTDLDLKKLRKTTLGFVGGDEFFVNSIIETSHGDLLAGTSEGVYLYQPLSNEWRCVQLKGVRVLNLYEDVSGRIWVSHYWGSTKVFEYGDLINEGQPKVLLFPGDNSRCVQFDAKRKVYLVATENGLRVVSQAYKEIKHIAQPEGLSNPFVYAVLLDNQFNYWVSTNGGINCIFPDKMVVQKYTQVDGLQSNEFNTGAYLKTATGYLLFGGINGFNFFKPEQVLARKRKLEIAIVEAAFVNSNSGERVVSLLSDIMLAPAFNSADISFLLPDYTNPADIKYFYQLKGKGNTWVDLGNKNRLFFSNLAPGRYELLLKAVDHNGVSIAPKSVLVFTIKAHFYQTNWFFLLCGFLVGFAVFLITRYLYRQRLKVALAEARRIAEIQKLRLNISRELHDNLGANLSRVSLITHKLKEMPAETNLHEAVSSISRLASEMNGQVRNIVWSIDNSYDDLESLRTYMRQFAGVFLEENGIEANIEFSETLPDLVLGPDVRQVLFSVVKESLNNTVKYSKTKVVDFFFTTQLNGSFEMKIKDYGIGFNQEVKRTFSHGLRNIHARLEELGFECHIDSAPGKGCETTIRGNFKILHS